ncbi:hypothetical protein BCR39DRAFT_512198 [Naematelia encephala]|uniref:Zn(2)-C6 fungal-type domain-containing protein n=1 Tax=Naematelia encephala TaxID=71784 RepID=A0A1Y2BLZ8_9TREE|nr:hypothetical protein BCR39DRAFT_512198 [Naematelia encephala]
MSHHHHRQEGGRIMSSIAEDGSESSPEDHHDHDARKRKRPTLSCLPCKKRKTKCDKKQPCSTCRTRNETVQCVYEDGSTPPPPQRFVSEEEFMDLKRRLEALESSSTVRGRGPSTTQQSASSTLNTPTSLVSQHPDGARAADVEKAFGDLEDLGYPIGTITNMNRCPLTSRSGGPLGTESDALWPSIVAIPGDGKFRSTRWARDMYELVQDIPGQQVTERLITHYFDRVHVSWRFLHEGVFRQELAQLWPILQTGAYLSIDPAWLAMLFSILCMSANDVAAAPESPNAASGLDKATLKDLTRRSYCSLEMALVCAGWLQRPQVRILLALLVAMPANGQGSCLASFDLLELDPSLTLWVDIAMRITKALRFHRLAASPIAPDPAFPPRESTYARQIASRAFHILFFLDTFIAGKQGLHQESYTFSEGTYNTPEPLNYTDDALLVETTPPRSWYEKTPEIWELHKIRIAKHWRRILAQLEEPGNFSYDVLLDIDRDLRKDHQELLALRLNFDLSPQENLLFGMVNSSYQQRLQRLHRPFLLPSYEEDKYRYSRTVTLSTARQILIGHRKLITDFGGDPIVANSLYLFAHHLSAVSILLAQAIKEPDVRAEIADQVRLSCDTFHLASLSEQRLFAKLGLKCQQICLAILDILDAPAGNFQCVEDVLRSVQITSSQAIADRCPRGHCPESNYDMFGGVNLLGPAVGAEMGNAAVNVQSHATDTGIPLWDFDWTDLILDA